MNLFAFSALFVTISAPNFVSSITKGDFVYFFFRETAVEFINCGKVSIAIGFTIEMFKLQIRIEYSLNRS